MKRLCLAFVLVICWVASASAARVYLKDGSRIDAKKVWREKGQVVVLVNRDSITTFTNAEINLKKTFPPRKKRIKPAAAAPAGTAAANSPGSGGAAPVEAQQPAKEGKKLSLPSLPTKLPEREPPKLSGDEGAIRKQKREMEQRLNE